MSSKQRRKTASSLAHSPNKSIAFAEAILTELQRSGVHHLCICPGSRSAPLALAATRIGGLERSTHLDERAAAFFALGMAKASRQPVAVMCTSGSAAANFLPAVIEAHYARVPLILLTADRPPELRECGAGQAIDQQKLFGTHLRWYAEAALPEADGEILRYARGLGSRTAAMAAGHPAGPVHLNLPFREPLDAQEVPEDRLAQLATSDPLADMGRPDRPFLRVRDGQLSPSLETIENLADLVIEHPEGLIVCGPEDEPALARAVARLAHAAAWPVLADVASQLRFGAHTSEAGFLSHYELFLREGKFASTSAPSCVLRFGASPTSKTYRLWMERHPEAQVILVDPCERWHDASHLASELLRCDPVELCERVAEELDARSATRASSAWLHRWREADARSCDIINAELREGSALREPWIGAVLTDMLPADASLFLSSSMPIRDLDAFAAGSPRGLRVFCNRGANGIDGILSSALGVSAAFRNGAEAPSPTVLLTGDLAFLHDVGGLLAATRLELDATILVIHNDGGGIFSFLPVAESAKPAAFEELFTTPHGLSLAPAARLYGLGYAHVATRGAFRKELAKSLAAPGVQVIELEVPREESIALFRDIATRVLAEVAELIDSQPEGARSR